MTAGTAVAGPVLIDGAHILHEGGFRTGSLLVRDGRIAALAWGDGDRAQLRQHAAEHVAADDCWLLPGLVDAHAHAYATVLRGTENGLPLELWALFTVLYGLALDAAALRAAILVGAAERLRCGITATVDHAPQMHLAEAAVAAHEASGLRVGYAPFLHDVSDYALMRLPLPAALGAWANGPPALDAPAYERHFAAIVAQARGGSGRVRPLLGPNAPQRCSPTAWELWRRLRDRHDVPVHTHLLETQAQARAGHEIWPGGTVAEMERQGLLDGRLSVAHGIWTTPAEQDLLARRGVTVVHNPASNLMLGSGLLPFAAYVRQGVSMALGTDSANTGGRHDLLEAMRLAFMLHRSPGSDPASWPQGARILDMATRNGAHVIGLGAETGRIEAGKLADLVLVRRTGAAAALFTETADAVVLHAGAEAVEAVMIGGAWALRGGRILAFDEPAALAGLVDIQASIRERVGAQPAAVRAILPGLAAALNRFNAHPPAQAAGPP